MAMIEITIRRRDDNSLLVREKFYVSQELAVEFVQKMEAMVAGLPGRHQTKKQPSGKGGMVVDIELNVGEASPPADGAAPRRVSPTFQELFSERAAGDAGIRRCPACGEQTTLRQVAHDTDR